MAFRPFQAGTAPEKGLDRRDKSKAIPGTLNRPRSKGRIRCLGTGKRKITRHRYAGQAEESRDHSSGLRQSACSVAVQPLDPRSSEGVVCMLCAYIRPLSRFQCVGCKCSLGHPVRRYRQSPTETFQCLPPLPRHSGIDSPLASSIHDITAGTPI